MVVTVRACKVTVLYEFQIQAMRQMRSVLPRSSWPLFMVQWRGLDFFHDVYVVNSDGQPGPNRAPVHGRFRLGAFNYFPAFLDEIAGTDR